MSEVVLQDADPQDLADVICGLTVIGQYSANAGLDDDASRINALRRRLILENRAVAEALLEADVTTTGTDPEGFMDGIAEILAEGYDAE